MNVEQEKEITRLEKQRQDLSQTLSKKVQNRINEFAAQGLLEFEHYFQIKGFTITKDHFSVTANNALSSATIAHEATNKRFLGTYLPFYLLLEFPEKSLNYTIYVSSKIYSFKSIIPNRNDILEKQKHLEQLIDRVTNFDNEKWIFIINKERDHANFNSLTEVLDYLLEINA